MTLEEEEEKLLDEVKKKDLRLVSLVYLLTLQMKDIKAELKGMHSEIIRIRAESEGTDLDEALDQANERIDNCLDHVPTSARIHRQARARRPCVAWHRMGVVVFYAVYTRCRLHVTWVECGTVGNVLRRCTGVQQRATRLQRNHL